MLRCEIKKLVKLLKLLKVTYYQYYCEINIAEIIAAILIPVKFVFQWRFLYNGHAVKIRWTFCNIQLDIYLNDSHKVPFPLDSILEAVLTASPKRQNRWLMLPISPVTHDPEADKTGMRQRTTECVTGRVVSVRASVRTCVRTHERTYARSNVRTYAHTHIRTYARTHVCTYVRMYVNQKLTNHVILMRIWA